MTEMELPLIQAEADACGCGHDHGDHNHDHSHAPDPAMADFERIFTDVAYGMQERFGGRQPTPEEEKAFMREWLINNGRTAEQADAILQ